MCMEQRQILQSVAKDFFLLSCGGLVGSAEFSSLGMYLTGGASSSKQAGGMKFIARFVQLALNHRRAGGGIRDTYQWEAVKRRANAVGWQGGQSGGEVVGCEHILLAVFVVVEEEVRRFTPLLSPALARLESGSAIRSPLESFIGNFTSCTKT